MRQYLELCKHILENGVKKEDRTGTGTLSVFGYQMRFDLTEGFPLLTTKDMGGKRLDGIIHELLWFLSGDTNIKYLVDNGVNIWNADAYRWLKSKNKIVPEDYTQEDFIKDIRIFAPGSKPKIADLGKIYGHQWRSWDVIAPWGDHLIVDQISEVIEQIKTNPDSRRHIVSAWNVGELNEMALPPCHTMFQFYVANGRLSCQLYQRSGDVFLGVPYNIASYALFTMMIADQCGLGYGEFIHTLGDAHIYTNHIEQVKLQLTRTPRPLPQMGMLIADDIFSYKRADFMLTDYFPHPEIKGKVSVGE